MVSDFCLHHLRGNHHVVATIYRATVDRFGIAAIVQIAATPGYIVMMRFIANASDIAPAGEDSTPAL